MGNISDILNDISHRPWDLPTGGWQYYQEWNDAIFLHFEVDFNTLRALIPQKLEIDSFEGKYYISIVPFTMQNIRPRYLPALELVSDFHEINVRTYIKNDNKAGVYFLNIEAEKWISTIVAKTLSGLPYEKSAIKRANGTYQNDNIKKSLQLHIDYRAANFITQKTRLDRWLTERYCLYLKDNHQLKRYDIHHKEWELQEIIISHIELDYKLQHIQLDHERIKSAHYSRGVQVLSWRSILI